MARSICSSALDWLANINAGSRAPSATIDPRFATRMRLYIRCRGCRLDRRLSRPLLPEPSENSIGPTGDRASPADISDALVAVGAPPTLHDHKQLPILLVAVAVLEPMHLVLHRVVYPPIGMTFLSPLDTINPPMIFEMIWIRGTIKRLPSPDKRSTVQVTHPSLPRRHAAWSSPQFHARIAGR